MPEGEPEIAYCHACGATMDVSQLAPFSNVECPLCRKHTRVKREFGPYTLLRRHAVGGMSVVFIAHDNTLNREVVVKILNEEYGGDEKRIGAFEEEARITASFSHPHVVRVFTTGRAFGRFYIAMELVGGGHYEHHIRERGSIPEAELLPLAIQVAEGLKAAQAAGLIHRDVKPGNILLDASGNAKLVDFGLALVTKGGKAKAAEIWATPYYVPPETIEGQPEDFRSDIYAFGATLYHALAGKPPCDEETMDTNKLREAKRRVLPLAKTAPGVSLDTCTAVDRAMAHDPEQRFRSYNELISALETARQRLANGNFADTPANRAEAAHSAKKDKFMLAGAALAVTAALAFGIWWIGRGKEAEIARQEAREPSRSALSLPGGEGLRTDRGTKAGQLYRDALSALRERNYEEARELFAAVREDPGVPEPTGSWAACEAVAAAFLDGSAAEARKEARAAIAHLEQAGVEPAVRDALAASLGQVQEFRPVARPPGEPPPTGPDLMIALVQGLKHWEQGLPELAQPYFEAVMAVEAKGADTWVDPYQTIIADYLADYEALRAVDPAVLPDTPAACRTLADELQGVYSALKTKGRARYNVRALQLDLEKRARLLENASPAIAAGTPEEETPAPPADPLAGALEEAARCRFAEAAALLKAASAGGSDMARTAAFLSLVEAAGSFLGELEDKLEDPPDGFSLQMKDDTRLPRITATRPGGLHAVDESGRSREVAWGDLSADSVIELHRALIKGETSELERLRRHEQAIAFDLLAGNPERAREAGEVLAARYPVFKRRWDQVQAAVR